MNNNCVTYNFFLQKSTDPCIHARKNPVTHTKYCITRAHKVHELINSLLQTKWHHCKYAYIVSQMCLQNTEKVLLLLLISLSLFLSPHHYSLHSFFPVPAKIDTFFPQILFLKQELSFSLSVLLPCPCKY